MRHFKRILFLCGWSLSPKGLMMLSMSWYHWDSVNKASKLPMLRSSSDSDDNADVISKSNNWNQRRHISWRTTSSDSFILMAFWQRRLRRDISSLALLVTDMKRLGLLSTCTCTRGGRLLSDNIYMSITIDEYEVPEKENRQSTDRFIQVQVVETQQELDWRRVK